MQQKKKKIALMNKNIHSGLSDVVKILIENGADVNSYSKQTRETILMRSAKHPDVMEKLLEYGADVNMKDNTGQTSLMYAAQYGETETVKILLEHGADINTKDDTGDTSLMKAAREGYTSSVKILLDHGADVNTKDDRGWSSLMFAVYFDYPELVKLLIEHRADINTKNKDGETALDLALRSTSYDRSPERAKIIDILREHGGEVNNNRKNSKKPKYRPYNSSLHQLRNSPKPGSIESYGLHQLLNSPKPGSIGSYGWS